jgi:hypothetical protein
MAGFEAHGGNYSGTTYVRVSLIGKAGLLMKQAVRLSTFLANDLKELSKRAPTGEATVLP